MMMMIMVVVVVAVDGHDGRGVPAPDFSTTAAFPL